MADDTQLSQSRSVDSSVDTHAYEISKSATQGTLRGDWPVRFREASAWLHQSDDDTGASYGVAVAPQGNEVDDGKRRKELEGLLHAYMKSEWLRGKSRDKERETEGESEVTQVNGR